MKCISTYSTESPSLRIFSQDREDDVFRSSATAFRRTIHRAAALLLVSILGWSSGCGGVSADQAVGPEQVRDQAVEWIRSAETEAVGPHDRWVFYDGGESSNWEPEDLADRYPFEPMFIEGSDFIFMGEAENGVVSEWVHASNPRLNEIWQEAGPEKGYLMVRHALAFAAAARFASPLNVLERMQVLPEVEERENEVVVRGSVTTSDLVGSDLPVEALERSGALDPTLPGAVRDIVLTVSRDDGAPLSMQIHYLPLGQVEVYTWKRVDRHALPPADVTELEEWGPVKEAGTLQQ
ncbi:MAG: hypothetical protein ACYCX3_11345 [Thermoleophilia bacterium]